MVAFGEAGDKGEKSLAVKHDACEMAAFGETALLPQEGGGGPTDAQKRLTKLQNISSFSAPVLTRTFAAAGDAILRKLHVSPRFTLPPPQSSSAAPSTSGRRWSFRSQCRGSS